MTEFGYTLSSEEFSPAELVRLAVQAENAGFTHAVISDHYHPWTNQQGQSNFVWGVLGGLARATRQIQIGTGVTCPLIRIHPAIVAQAAVTVASMMPGRFFLGVGTGENLNEHILGDRWPPIGERREMLEEALTVIRELWKGKKYSHKGRYYTVSDARLYSLPPEPPPIYMAASGTKSAELAGQIADGLISVAPDARVVETFEKAGGAGKPKYAQVAVCWASDVDEARRIALKWWPTVGLKGRLSQELAKPADFEAAAAGVTEDDVAAKIVCGPDPSVHLKALEKYVDAGFDHVYVHQVGPDQDGFFDFYSREVLSAL